MLGYLNFNIVRNIHLWLKNGLALQSIFRQCADIRVTEHSTPTPLTQILQVISFSELGLLM